MKALKVRFHRKGTMIGAKTIKAPKATRGEEIHLLYSDINDYVIFSSIHGTSLLNTHLFLKQNDTSSYWNCNSVEEAKTIIKNFKKIIKNINKEE